MDTGRSIISPAEQRCSGSQLGPFSGGANRCVVGPAQVVHAGPSRGPSTRRLSAEGADLHLRRSSLGGWQIGSACGSPSSQAPDSAGSWAGPGGCGRQSGLTEELVDRTPGPSPGGSGGVPDSSYVGSWDTPSAVSAVGGTGDGQYACAASAMAGVGRRGKMPLVPGSADLRDTPPAGGGQRLPFMGMRCGLDGGEVPSPGPWNLRIPGAAELRPGASQLTSEKGAH